MARAKKTLSAKKTAPVRSKAIKKDTTKRTKAKADKKVAKAASVLKLSKTK